MTRPMTGQPATLDELEAANKRADNDVGPKGFDEDDDMPEADSLEEYRAKKAEQRNEKSDDEKLEELREFKENNPDLYEDNGKGGQQIAVSDDETEMVVTDNDGETTTYTRDEWDNERGTRARTWKRMARTGLMFVRVARWFNDTDVNKVQTGRGFYGHKVGETDKALKFEVPADSTHTAEAETVWLPKKAVRTHELKE